MKSNISQPTTVTMDLSLCVLHGTCPARTGERNSNALRNGTKKLQKVVAFKFV